MCQHDGLMFDQLPHVWLGATFCNQDEWDRDADKLFATPARVHFGSFEPLLGPIDVMQCPECGGAGVTTGHYFSDTGTETCERCRGTGARAYLDLGWAIVGGESGPAARPMHPHWALNLRDQCAEAGVPFLFKQWGEWTPGVNVDRYSGTVDTALWFADKWVFGRENLASFGGHIDDEPDLYRVGKKAAGRLLDGVQHDGFPEA
jgi:protein gp37